MASQKRSDRLVDKRRIGGVDKQITFGRLIGRPTCNVGGIKTGTCGVLGTRARKARAGQTLAQCMAEESKDGCMLPYRPAIRHFVAELGRIAGALLANQVPENQEVPVQSTSMVVLEPTAPPPPPPPTARLPPMTDDQLVARVLKLVRNQKLSKGLQNQLKAELCKKKS